MKVKQKIWPVLPLRPILFSCPPGAGGNHIVSLLNGSGQFTGRHVQVDSSVKEIEHSILYKAVNSEVYNQTINRLLETGVNAIASHSVIIPNNVNILPVRGLWTNPKLNVIFAARDVLTADVANIQDHIRQDKKYQLLKRSPISFRKKWILFFKDLVEHGEAYQDCQLQGWTTFNINNLFDDKLVDDLAKLAKFASIEFDVDTARQQHKQWMIRNPLKDYTVKRAVRHLEKFTL